MRKNKRQHREIRKSPDITPPLGRSDLDAMGRWSQSGFFECDVGLQDWFGGNRGLTVEQRHHFHLPRSSPHIQNLSTSPSIATCHGKVDYPESFRLRNVLHHRRSPEEGVVCYDVQIDPGGLALI